ncbi:high mobility group box domain-containing protein [Mycena filopes]|nr:high mobility group box domain-containing protein [Mycena filopes]
MSGMGLPKQPTTAYMLFCADQRQGFRDANPDASFGTLIKLLSKAWWAFSEDERKVYENRAAKDVVRYHRELAHYEAAK